MHVYLAQVGPTLIPEAYMTASLALFMAFCVCWALARVWHSTIGWLFTTLADLLDRVAFLGHHVFGPVSAFLRTLDRNVNHALAKAALKCEAGAASLWNTGWHDLLWMARELRHLAESTGAALVRAQVFGEKQLLRLIYANTVGRFRAIASQLSYLLKHVVPFVYKQAIAVEKRIAHAAAIPFHAIHELQVRVGQTAKQLRRLGRRVSHLEAITTGAAAAALVATALRRMDINWIRCSNWRRIGKGVCRLDTGMVESLFSNAIEALIVLDLCRFALAAQRVARLVVPELGVLLLVPNAVCLGGGGSLPTAADNPPTRTRITLPSAHD